MILVTLHRHVVEKLRRVATLLARRKGRSPATANRAVPSSNEATPMSIDRFPIGLELDVTYPNVQASLTLLSAAHLKFEIKDGPSARSETVDIHVVPLGNGIFVVSWQEKDGGTFGIRADVSYGHVLS